MRLRSPMFGNTQILDTGAVVRRNLSGGLLIAYDPTWPPSESFKYEFQALKTDEKDALVNYMIQSAAQLITMVDFENVTWRGIIRSPFTVTDVGIDPGCYFNVSFEFEGNLV